MEKITITVIGKSTVGKSSITYQYLGKDVPLECDPTIEDKYKKIENINGKNVEVNIIDTAGEEDYQNFVSSWIKEGDCFLIVFAINDKESFDLVEEKYRKIKTIKEKEVPILVVANKIDLQNERVVDEKMCKDLCDKLNVDYIQTSAKTGCNCKEAFIDVATQLFTKVEKFETSDKKNDKNDKTNDKNNEKNENKGSCPCIIV